MIGAECRHNEAPDSGALKEQFLNALASISANVRCLREAVLALIGRGFKRSQLVRWAVAAGYSRGHVRNVINQILREAGWCERRSGAGPKPPAEALALLNYACERYGVRGPKYLLAAYRAGRKTGAALTLRAAPSLNMSQVKPLVAD
jgi:hypothetical protein